MGELRVLRIVDNYDEMLRFYEHTLGFPIHDQWDGPTSRGALLHVSDTGMIEIAEASPDYPAQRPVGVILAIEVDDVDVFHARLVDQGVTITDGLTDRPWGHRNFSVVDPLGTVLYFFMNLGD